jgi:hypothetical protein
MATMQYVKYPSNSGGSGNISSINGETGPAISIVAGTGISIGTLGNTITVTNTGSGSTTEELEYRVLTAPEVAAKSIILGALPIDGTKVMVDTVGGCSQIYSTDFIVSGMVLDWTGLGLDGLLAAGDVLRIHFLS